VWLTHARAGSLQLLFKLGLYRCVRVHTAAGVLAGWVVAERNGGCNCLRIFKMPMTHTLVSRPQSRTASACPWALPSLLMTAESCAACLLCCCGVWSSLEGKVARRRGSGGLGWICTVTISHLVISILGAAARPPPAASQTGKFQQPLGHRQSPSTLQKHILCPSTLTRWTRAPQGYVATSVALSNSGHTTN
jgi:hypothetical protein